MSEEHLDQIKGIQKIGAEDSEQAASARPEVQVPSKEGFEAALDAAKPGAVPGLQTEDSLKPSLMDEVRRANYHSEAQGLVTRDSLIKQTKQLLSKIEGVRKTLSEPDVTIKNSAQQLLGSKLIHIDESLKVALSKAGLDYEGLSSVAAPVEEGKGPIHRFLGLLADGENQLNNLTNELDAMGREKRNISPVDMLAIQVKVGYIQREIELFTTLLSKSLESIKTIMNIQV